MDDSPGGQMITAITEDTPCIVLGIGGRPAMTFSERARRIPADDFAPPWLAVELK